MMLQSRYDPVTKKIVYGAAAGPQPALPMPAAAPASAPIGAMPVPARAAPAPGAPVMSAGPGREMEVTLPEISVGPPQAPAAGAGQAMPGGFNSGGGMMRKPLGQLYTELEQERGLPAGYLAKTRAIESSNGTRLANPNSSARGDFQFIRSTAKQFGIDPMDPYQSATAAADMAKQNMDVMRKKGINPDGADLYAAHQQGIGGYLQLRGGGRTSDAAMGLNGGAGLSGTEMLAKWRTKFDNAKVANLDGFTPPPSPGANQGQGPTVAAAQAQGGVQNQTPSGVPAVADNTYKGGILGLFGMGDQSKPGMNKDFSGKMGDMLAQPGGGAVGGMAQAIAAMMGGGGAKAPAPVNFGPAPEDHRPDVSLMALLDPKRRRQGVA